MGNYTPAKKIIKACLHCNVETLMDPRSKMCSSECKREFNIKENIIRSIEKYKDDDSIPTCKICGFKAESLQMHIQSIHKMKVSDYQKKFNCGAEATVCSRLRTVFSENVKGEKNVWFNHGGTLSPFSKKSKQYSHMTDEELDIQLKKMYSLISETMKGNDNANNTRIEYYLNQGMNEEEAGVALKKRQTTFSLEKCISKYGEVEGKRKWLERQEKWQNTLTSKSQEEIADINRRKLQFNGYSQMSQRLFASLNIREARYAMNGRRISYKIIKWKTRII